MAHGTPVAIIVFNRPQVVRQLLARLAELRPKTLFVIGDGPRPHKAGEAELVQAVRDQVAKISWPCEVVADYAAENFGCRRRVVSGLNWVFGQVDKAIILEDDCLPTPSFMTYAGELLDRFRNDSRIGSVCGSLSVPSIPPIDGDYFFSRYNLFTGWATWRRAWSLYDDDMRPVDVGSLDQVLQATFEHQRARLYWRYVLQRTHAGLINSWGYRWMLSCWANSMLAAFPRCTLVDNVGFGDDATNTRGQAWYFRQRLGELPSPLAHPRHMCRNAKIDRLIEDARYSKNVAGRLRWALERLNHDTRN
ncbi:MAG: glycosyltransferase family 2 protein [Planctomycetes bacterium]|nr:glycosyltransferase family 2 protein [Planctomycetota bacterium]